MADASQFTQFKKLKAIANRGLVDKSTKSITHLYQPVPSTSSLVDFLPSKINKFTSAPNQVRTFFGGSPAKKGNQVCK